MAVKEIVTLTENGLYCPFGDFYVDPWRPVQRAIITHAHADHARQGSVRYLTAVEGERLLRTRLQPDAAIETLAYGQALTIGAARVSLHPAGHVLGSAQVRIEVEGQVWVVSGDYKTEAEKTCTPFELVACHTFITESTFGLPIFRWHTESEVFDEINKWWSTNKANGKASLLFSYALGKSQRILSGIDAGIGPIYTHGAVEKITAVYRESGVRLPDTTHVSAMPPRTKFSGSLILAPPSAQATPWMRKFGTLSTAFASGWMRIRGTRRRKSVDRGFVLSDHADWPALNSVIRHTGASHVIVTHGYTAEMVRWLNENGVGAAAFSTRFEGELEELQPSSGEDEIASAPGSAKEQDVAGFLP